MTGTPITTAAPSGLIDTSRPALRPDPRTTLLAVCLVNGLALGNTTFTVALAAANLVVVLLASARRFRAALVVAGLYTLCAGLTLYTTITGNTLSGNTGLSTGISVTAYWLARFTIAIGAGLWAITVIRPVELIDALHRIRTPRSIIIPLAVVVRIFPVIATEGAAIIDAMTLRGIRPGMLSLLAHPIRTGELVVIPLLTTVVRAGDELAAAAMIRGLGGPHRPVSIVTPAFRPIDAVLLAALTSLLVLTFTGWELGL